MKTKLSFWQWLIVIPFAIIVAVGIILLINFVPFLIWNKAIAPMFEWRLITYWQCLGICMAISFVGRLLFGR